MKKNEVKPLPTQPVKCKGCIWGTWNGTIQYCSKITCVKAVKAIEICPADP